MTSPHRRLVSRADALPLALIVAGVLGLVVLVPRAALAVSAGAVPLAVPVLAVAVVLVAVSR